MTNLFTFELNGWNSWSKVFQSIKDFQSLIKYIYESNFLPLSQIEQCTPGTNAVFKVGSTVIKIFAPKESGFDSDSDYVTELFGMERANKLGISTPKLLAKGIVEDQYVFPYLIMEYIPGGSFGMLESQWTDDEKTNFAKQLHCITDLMNTSCEPFNYLDVIDRALYCQRWSKFPRSFQQERRKYLEQYKGSSQVYVHGDLNPDNVLVDHNGKLYIIDFADAVIAPPEYEFAAIVCELFCFEKPYMIGYFGEYNIEELAEKCFNAILMHDFGAGIIECNLGRINEIASLSVLKERLCIAIKNNKGIE